MAPFGPGGQQCPSSPPGISKVHLRPPLQESDCLDLRLVTVDPKGYYGARYAHLEPLAGSSCPTRRLENSTGDRLSDNNRQGDVAKPKRFEGAVHCALDGAGRIGRGDASGVWVGGGTDRYGEDDGVRRRARRGYGTMVRSYRYSDATIRDCMSQDRSLVRNLGLVRQIETRIWQDKRLAAEAIVVAVEDGGKAVLKGKCPMRRIKTGRWAGLRYRGVETVIDQLAVATGSRTINTPSSPAVPTGVTSGARVLR